MTQIQRTHLDGSIRNPTTLLRHLRQAIIPPAIDKMNTSLPLELPLFPTDRLPTNQRNLTDFRTRIGVMLEYGFAQAVNSMLPSDMREDALTLSYVVANQFPDLAFRSADGSIGVRIEAKAVQTTAEEKSANFKTLIKDIRKGTDFVVVFLWEWKQHVTMNRKYPHVEACYVMDAYELAQIRDNYWLNTPPKKGVPNARQGFDLAFAVNANQDKYNEEEKNLGKLMRISDAKKEKHLPAAIRNGDTLRTYTQFKSEAIRLGSLQVGTAIATRASQQANRTYRVISETLPVCLIVEEDDRRLLIIANDEMPKKKDTTKAMSDNQASQALIMNDKFNWSAYGEDWEFLASGRKPSQAELWVEQNWVPTARRHLI